MRTLMVLDDTAKITGFLPCNPGSYTILEGFSAVFGHFQEVRTHPEKCNFFRITPDFDDESAQFPSGRRIRTPHLEQNIESLCSNSPCGPCHFARFLQSEIFGKTRRISRIFYPLFRRVVFLFCKILIFILQCRQRRRGC